MKGLINIKNNGSKYFLWCHIRNLNGPKIHPERITKADKDMVSDLDYKCINFTVSKKDYYRIEQKKNVCINVFCYGTDLVYTTYVPNKKFKNYMDLLMIAD